MQPVLCLLLISLGGFFLVGSFHASIYLQQKDKAYLHYALYLFVMSAFCTVRLLDERLTQFLPLSYYTVETLDPMLSNLGFLMYVNFLGIALNVQPQERFYYRCWRLLRASIPFFIVVYGILRFARLGPIASGSLISLASLVICGFGFILTLRLVRGYRDTFNRLIISGTIVAVVGTLAGLLVNGLVYHDKLAFGGLSCMLSAMLLETIFLSAALGYRLKQFYQEREAARQALLEETRRSEALAQQTAALLRAELDVQTLKTRISRDLHDDVGATLSSIHIYSSVARSLIEQQPERARAMLDQIGENARNVIDNMSDIVWAMNGGEGEQSSLSARIRNLGSELLGAVNIEATYWFDSDIDERLLDVHHRRNLCLLVKEAFNNIVKYSAATQVLVEGRVTTGGWQLQIGDNGRGFDPSSVRKGNGLRHLHARAADIGGSFLIESAPGQGTLICCQLPLPTSREDVPATVPVSLQS
ncbi:MAG: sensor histidine kinase [Chitinophagaceae bacterium]|nr:MAG: sensor histidine kinase [Chitinophagaceae bacterium]